MDEGDEYVDISELEDKLYSQIHHDASKTVPNVLQNNLRSKVTRTNSLKIAPTTHKSGNQYYGKNKQSAKSQLEKKSSECVNKNSPIPSGSHAKEFTSYSSHISQIDCERKNELKTNEEQKKFSKNINNTNKSSDKQPNPFNRLNDHKMQQKKKMELKKDRASKNRAQNAAKKAEESNAVPSDDDDVIVLPTPPIPLLMIDSSEDENEKPSTFNDNENTSDKQKHCEERAVSPTYSNTSDDFIKKGDRHRQTKSNIEDPFLGVDDEELNFIHVTVDSVLKNTSSKNNNNSSVGVCAVINLTDASPVLTNPIELSPVESNNTPDEIPTPNDFVPPPVQSRSMDKSYEVNDNCFAAVDVYESESSDLPESVYKKGGKTSKTIELNSETSDVELNPSKRSKRMTKRKTSGSNKGSDYICSSNDNSDDESEFLRETNNHSSTPYLKRGEAVANAVTKSRKTKVTPKRKKLDMKDQSDEEFLSMLSCIVHNESELDISTISAEKSGNAKENNDMNLSEDRVINDNISKITNESEDVEKNENLDTDFEMSADGNSVWIVTDQVGVFDDEADLPIEMDADDWVIKDQIGETDEVDDIQLNISNDNDQREDTDISTVKSRDKESEKQTTTDQTKEPKLVPKNQTKKYPTNEKDKKRTEFHKNKLRELLKTVESEANQDNIEKSVEHVDPEIGWNDEMKQFYHKSWGGETYNVREIQNRMPKATFEWIINKEDKYPRFNKLNKSLRCINCCEIGHKRQHCTQRQKELICAKCGERGHRETRCPNAICLRCGAKNKLYVQGCSRCAKKVYFFCTLCKLKGHSQSECPDKWRRYHSTTIPNTTRLSKNKQTHNLIYCCICATRGHTSESCVNALRVFNGPITSSKIYSYAPCYDKTEENDFDKTASYALISLPPHRNAQFNWHVNEESNRFYDRFTNATNLKREQLASIIKRSKNKSDKGPSSKIKKSNLVLNPMNENNLVLNPLNEPNLVLNPMNASQRKKEKTKKSTVKNVSASEPQTEKDKGNIGGMKTDSNKKKETNMGNDKQDEKSDENQMVKKNVKESGKSKLVKNIYATKNTKTDVEEPKESGETSKKKLVKNMFAEKGKTPIKRSNNNVEIIDENKTYVVYDDKPDDDVVVEIIDESASYVVYNEKPQYKFDVQILDESPSHVVYSSTSNNEAIIQKKKIPEKNINPMCLLDKSNATACGKVIEVVVSNSRTDNNSDKNEEMLHSKKSKPSPFTANIDLTKSNDKTTTSNESEHSTFNFVTAVNEMQYNNDKNKFDLSFISAGIEDESKKDRSIFNISHPLKSTEIHTLISPIAMKRNELKFDLSFISAKTENQISASPLVEISTPKSTQVGRIFEEEDKKLKTSPVDKIIETPKAIPSFVTENRSDKPIKPKPGVSRFEQEQNKPTIIPIIVNQQIAPFSGINRPILPNTNIHGIRPINQPKPNPFFSNLIHSKQQANMYRPPPPPPGLHLNPMRIPKPPPICGYYPEQLNIYPHFGNVEMHMNRFMPPCGGVQRPVMMQQLPMQRPPPTIRMPPVIVRMPPVRVRIPPSRGILQQSPVMMQQQSAMIQQPLSCDKEYNKNQSYPTLEKINKPATANMVVPISIDLYPQHTSNLHKQTDDLYRTKKSETPSTSTGSGSKSVMQISNNEGIVDQQQQNYRNNPNKANAVKESSNNITLKPTTLNQSVGENKNKGKFTYKTTSIIPIDDGHEKEVNPTEIRRMYAKERFIKELKDKKEVNTIPNDEDNINLRLIQCEPQTSYSTISLHDSDSNYSFSEYFANDKSDNDSNQPQNKIRFKDVEHLPEFIPLSPYTDASDSNNESLDDFDFELGVSNNLNNPTIPSKCDAQIFLTKDHCKYLLNEKGTEFLSKSSTKYNLIIHIEYGKHGNMLVVTGYPTAQNTFHCELINFLKETEERSKKNDLISQQIPKNRSTVIKLIRENLMQLEESLGNVKSLFVRMRINERQNTKAGKKTAEKARKQLNMILIGQAGLRDGHIHLKAIQKLLRDLLESKREKLTDNFRFQLYTHFQYIFTSIIHNDYAKLIHEYTTLKKNQELPPLNLDRTLLGLNINVRDNTNLQEAKQKLLNTLNSSVAVAIPMTKYEPEKSFNDICNEMEIQTTKNAWEIKCFELMDNVLQSVSSAESSSGVMDNEKKHASTLWSKKCVDLIDQCRSVSKIVSNQPIMRQLDRVAAKARENMLSYSDYRSLMKIFDVAVKG